MKPDETSSPALSRKEERLLVKLASETSRVDRPNPDRRGCPGRDVLAAVAGRKLQGDELGAAVDHIANCSPCFVEYEQIRHSPRVKRLLALCVAIALIGVLVLMRLRSEKEPAPTVTKAPVVTSPVPPTAPAPVNVALNLRDRGPRRGTASAQRPPLVLPRGAIDLNAQLPPGSDVGSYEVAIFTEGRLAVGPVNGTAVFRNRNEVLRVRMDTSALPPGPYQLRLRPIGAAWQSFQILVE